jgi:hypothetical protein
MPAQIFARKVGRRGLSTRGARRTDLSNGLLPGFGKRGDAALWRPPLHPERLHFGAWRRNCTVSRALRMRKESKGTADCTRESQPATVQVVHPT